MSRSTVITPEWLQEELLACMIDHRWNVPPSALLRPDHPHEPGIVPQRVEITRRVEYLPAA